MNWTWFHKLGSPKWFYEISSRWLPWLALAAAVLLLVGLVWGLAFAPPDYQQGNSFRIIYIHVPAAFLAQSIYVMLAVAGTVGLVWKMKLADVALQQADHPLGLGHVGGDFLDGAFLARRQFEWQGTKRCLVQAPVAFGGAAAQSAVVMSHQSNRQLAGQKFIEGEAGAGRIEGREVGFVGRRMGAGQR